MCRYLSLTAGDFLFVCVYTDTWEEIRGGIWRKREKEDGGAYCSVKSYTTVAPWYR